MGQLNGKRDIITVGTSAGGVEALCQLVEKLPAGLDASVFIVMHIGSESMLPHILSRCGKLPAVHARNQEPYQRGHIYVAPSNHHLAIKDGVTVLSRGPRENGHRPAVDVLFRSAARAHRERVAGVVLSGGLDDGAAGLFTIKARGGVAVVQDPREALAPDMPRAALETVDVDYCLPISKIAAILADLALGKNGASKESKRKDDMPEQMTSEDAALHAPETHIPLACPECSGPLYEVKEGNSAHFRCFLGHGFSPDSLTEEQTDALERALWIAMRTLKERSLLHRKLLERKRLNKGEEELLKRLEESISTADSDAKLIREILDRI